jgi:hypothetical protein
MHTDFLGRCSPRSISRWGNSPFSARDLMSFFHERLDAALPNFENHRVIPGVRLSGASESASYSRSRPCRKNQRDRGGHVSSRTGHSFQERGDYEYFERRAYTEARSAALSRAYIQKLAGASSASRSAQTDGDGATIR